MMNNKNKASLRSFETRLENEHNDPEPPPEMRECARCDDETIPRLSEPTFCGQCEVPYRYDDIEAVEYLLDAFTGSQAHVHRLTGLARLLYHHLDHGGWTASQVENLRDDLKTHGLFDTWNQAMPNGKIFTYDSRSRPRPDPAVAARLAEGRRTYQESLNLAVQTDSHAYADKDDPVRMMERVHQLSLTWGGDPLVAYNYALEYWHSL
ncbi:hypothetical protein CMI37_18005 [Candidatus Pacearchaeota archaeon]|nr:hypothetical protein [Candidatus Pacearchaeota archaeon]